MDKIEKIRAEIERRIKIYHESNHGFSLRCDECEELLTFLDTLSEEPDKSLEEAAEAYQQQVIEETKNHIHLPQHTYAEGFEDALHLISDAFIAGWEYRSECEESSIMGDLLKTILRVGAQHNFGFGPDLIQRKDNEDESK